MGVRCLIHQPRYNMLDRWVENGLLNALPELGIGCIPFSPLGQGLLSGRYLDGVIPADSRAASKDGFLKADAITPTHVKILQSLAAVAQERGQSLAQMALAWILRQSAVTSVLIGASRLSQIDDNLGALENTAFGPEELARIDAALSGWNAA
jgi:L-glyceraldehyde 3-phosphate reductase